MTRYEQVFVFQPIEKTLQIPQKKPYLALCLQLPATKKIWTFKDVQNKCTRGWSRPDKESYQCPS